MLNFIIFGFLFIVAALILLNGIHVVSGDKIGRFEFLGERPDKVVDPGFYWRFPLLFRKDVRSTRQQLIEHTIQRLCTVTKKPKEDGDAKNASKDKNDEDYETYVALPYALEVVISNDPKKALRAFYAHDKSMDAIQQSAEQELRAIANGMSYEEIQKDKDKVAKKLEEELKKRLDELGYEFVKLTIQDPDPGEDIIGAAQRQAVAIRERNAVDAENETLGKRLNGRAEVIAAARKHLISELKKEDKDAENGSEKLNDEQINRIVDMTLAQEIADKGGSIFVSVGGDVTTEKKVTQAA